VNSYRAEERRHNVNGSSRRSSRKPH
jgi:hypothetical protein